MKYNVKYTYLLAFVFLLSCGKLSKNNLIKLASLSSLLNESSGIENINGAPTFWMINDSGNAAELFEVTEDGKIIQIVKVKNSKNKDWEDLATDHERRIFIGDFGNNNNKRRDLSIYHIDTSTIENKEVQALQTTFNFEDQKKFPPKKKDRNFDVEAFVFFKGAFYLFTKNRSHKFNGVTKLYKILAEPGHQEARLISQFKICQEAKNCEVTSATISKDNKELVLLTRHEILKFSNFREDEFFNGDLEEIFFEKNTQKEAICFKDNHLYLTDEANKNVSAKLYRIK